MKIDKQSLNSEEAILSEIVNIVKRASAEDSKMGTLHQFRPHSLQDDQQAYPYRRATLVSPPQSVAKKTDKRVVLRLGKTGPEGIPVNLQLGDEGQLPHTEVTGWLPPVASLLATQSCWQRAYRKIHLQGFRIHAPQVQITNVSYQEDREHSRRVERVLTRQINHWLNSERFRPVRETLLSFLHPADIIRIMLQTDELQIRSLPWHLWDWFARYPHAELVLSEPTYRRIIETPYSAQPDCNRKRNIFTAFPVLSSNT